MVWEVKYAFSSPTSNRPVRAGLPRLLSLSGGPARDTPQPVKVQRRRVMPVIPPHHMPQEEVRHCASAREREQSATVMLWPTA